MNILTFDIEDWFHIRFDKEFNTEINFSSFPSILEKNTDLILHELSENNYKATFYCLGWVAKKYPHVVKKIYMEGHEIGSHTNNHNLLTNLTYDEFKISLKESINRLEDITGKRVLHFRAPAFSLTDNRLDYISTLIDHGIKFDSSIFPARRDFGGSKNIREREPFIFCASNGESLKEFPMSYFKMAGFKFVFSGGGYFRLYPGGVINRLLKRNGYNMFYLHPRDFEPNQPILEGLGNKRKLLSYYNLKGTKSKFSNMLGKNEFLSIEQANERVDWNNTKRIDI